MIKFWLLFYAVSLPDMAPHHRFNDGVYRSGATLLVTPSLLIQSGEFEGAEPPHWWSPDSSGTPLLKIHVPGPSWASEQQRANATAARAGTPRTNASEGLPSYDTPISRPCSADRFDVWALIAQRLGARADPEHGRHISFRIPGSSPSEGEGWVQRDEARLISPKLETLPPKFYPNPWILNNPGLGAKGRSKAIDPKLEPLPPKFWMTPKSDPRVGAVPFTDQLLIKKLSYNEWKLAKIRKITLIVN